MNRTQRAGLGFAVAVMLLASAAMLIQPARSIGFGEAILGRFIVQTIAAKRAEHRDRRDINVRRDEELAQADLRMRAVDYSEKTKRMTAAEAEAQRAQIELQKIAIEERAKRERQVVSFQTRRRIDANLRSSFTDAIKVATGADPRAIELLSGLIQGKKPLQAALDAAVAEAPKDPRQPFRDLQAQLKEVDKAARALGGAKAVDIRARVRQALEETTGLASGDGPPPDDKIQRLRELDQEISRVVEQTGDILRDLFPGSPGIDRSRFAGNERWQQLDQEVQRLNGPVAGREAVSSILRRARERITELREGETSISDEDADRFARDVADKWAEQRRSGESTATAVEADIDGLIDLVAATREGMRPVDVPPARDDEPEAPKQPPPNSDQTRDNTATATARATPVATATPGMGATATPSATKTATAIGSTNTETPTVTVTATPTAEVTATATPQGPTSTPTATATPTTPPTPTSAPVTNFAGSWRSSGTCDNPAAPNRWSVNLSQSGSQVTGTITFHNCPGGGRAEYVVSGTATSAASVTLQGTKTLALGGLGSATPGSVAFTVTKNGAPSPNYAP